ncbi:copper homeostasis protein CutC [Lacimicrobium alkaliphilum]|uniref:Copper homeostasis protein cutC homolog n=1 Tax=Lacimicrobium alkaliphilum TaxID=1526571 RepID=A0ABQ1RHK5_9ALTE|nr:copper homeostasis protein CutC [Lacimicrobium alkaliphilum]GGD70748.1 copper homeostasis protein CutC [Lacimicrobium alkaliphilum]
MNELEICLDADDLDALAEQIRTVRTGGAARIELCGAMAQQGLTPGVEAMQIAREAFGEAPGLLVMVRPRSGDFCYQPQHVAQMSQTIEQAADAGADGIVLGLLDKHQTLDLMQLGPLVEQAKQAQMAVTFHRAFDAIEHWQPALDSLIELGVDRLLSAGTPWGSADGVMLGLGRLREMANRAQGHIELVVGGGIGLSNLSAIRSGLPVRQYPISFHSHSAVLTQGRVDPVKVAGLANLLV